MSSRYVAPTSPNGFVILQSTDPLQAIGEFLGTFLFLFFAFAGAQVANEAETLTGSDAPTPSIGALLYISLSFGFSLAVCAWVFFRISGGLFNPAVTLALTLIGCLTYTRAAVVIIAQIVGAITSAGIVKVLFPEVRLVPNLAQQRRVD
jgi:aquaporin related protein